MKTSHILLLAVGAYFLFNSTPVFGRGGVPDGATETVNGVPLVYSARDDSWAPEALASTTGFKAGQTVTIRGGTFVWRAGLGKFERL